MASGTRVLVPDADKSIVLLKTKLVAVNSEGLVVGPHEPRTVKRIVSPQ